MKRGRGRKESNMSQRIFVCLWACSAVACGIALPPAVADDFRVETEVHAEKQTQPVSENLTLFNGATAYDFELTDPPKTTIFDTTGKQIVMLDPGRQVRTTITRDDLLHFVAALQTR